ncbi:hypothetical protein SAMN04488548_10311 [Gordonia westfalica]|uniref:Uncharacterized protein n=1 Tax=Gordonia westfalica TaxID=158898 RepID=A0A1H2DLF9_9ACTN|nr:hypothetical protein SAMN04488548_10311 [Gordonia westfalica]
MPPRVKNAVAEMVIRALVTPEEVMAGARSLTDSAGPISQTTAWSVRAPNSGLQMSESDLKLAASFRWQEGKSLSRHRRGIPAVFDVEHLPFNGTGADDYGNDVESWGEPDPRKFVTFIDPQSDELDLPGTSGTPLTWNHRPPRFRSGVTT